MPQKAQFCSLALSTNLLQNAVGITGDQYLCKGFTFSYDNFLSIYDIIICRLFNVLLQFLVTTSETKLDYYLLLN